MLKRLKNTNKITTLRQLKDSNRQKSDNQVHTLADLDSPPKTMVICYQRHKQYHINLHYFQCTRKKRGTHVEIHILVIKT